MLGWSELKETISVGANTVECPVRTCEMIVERQRGSFVNEDRFTCPIHQICISPSTFEYPDERDNMLWTGKADMQLWKSIGAVKRESRVSRDNSEDALTWNVFRYLEVNAQTGGFVDWFTANGLAPHPHLIYWSFCQNEQGPLPDLVEAATTFGEHVNRRSEPDLIIDDDDVLVFVENKFTASNRTQPTNPHDSKKYMTGGNTWFHTVFQAEASFTSIAVDGRLYELMRLWLLGSWMAKQAGKQFLLVNVVRDGTEEDIEARFNVFIRNDPTRSFVRCTWEGIFAEFVQPAARTPDSDRLSKYMREKTRGYWPANNGMQCHLVRAFNLLQ